MTPCLTAPSTNARSTFFLGTWLRFVAMIFGQDGRWSVIVEPVRLRYCPRPRSRSAWIKPTSARGIVLKLKRTGRANSQEQAKRLGKRNKR